MTREPTVGPPFRLRTPDALVATTFAAAFLLLHAVAVGTRAGQLLDREGFILSAGTDPGLVALASVLRDALPIVGGVLLAALAVVAIRQGHGRAVPGIGALLLICVVLARVLRDHVLDRPDLGVHGFDLNSYPSGHVTVTTALAVGVIVLVRHTTPRWPVVVIVSLLTILAAVASVLARAHRPADVLGALLLVGAVTAGIRALGGLASPAPTPRPEARERVTA